MPGASIGGPLRVFLKERMLAGPVKDLQLTHRPENTAPIVSKKVSSINPSNDAGILGGSEQFCRTWAMG